MAKPTETAEQIAQWIAEEWGRCLAGVIESMADQRPVTACDGLAVPFLPAEGALHSEQELSLGPEYVVRTSVPEPVWLEAGSRVLKAAGIDEVGRDDALSTFHEVLSQTLSGVAQAIGARLGREVTCGTRSDRESLPEVTLGLSLSVELPDIDLSASPVFISATNELVQKIRDAVLQPEPAVQPSPAQAVPAGTLPSSISKTFDLLLGVHLPVSVSFGKTSMMVKEVLKLTTGSIVELNRAVTEPVDIIVNNCIIARGDVVVVAGNYGVRVREIVSKEQRYETGIRPPLVPTRVEV
jgi:flagellar motor switch protein FliN/FliY